MTNHVTVATHGQRISRFGLAFALGVVGYVLAVNLLYLYLLGSLSDFFTPGNLKWILFFAGFICACALYRLHRLSGDGANVAQWMGGRLVVLEPREERLRRCRNVATEVAIAAAIPMPRLFVLESDHRINAFAAGTLEEGVAICVSAGALEKLDRYELQGVVAHEMAHLRHDDARVSRLLASGIFGLVCIAAVGGLLAWVGGKAAGTGAKEGLGGGLVLALAGLVVLLIGSAGWLAAALLDAATSREMELRADADAVRMLSDSSGLVGALVKLGVEAHQFPEEAWDWFKGRNPMYFNASVKRYWFDTHPPLFDRIQALDPGKAAELRTRMGG